MGNQQVGPFERGWLCGVIDGEGTISMHVRKPSPKHGQKQSRIIPYFALRSVDHEMLVAVQMTLKTLDIPCHVHWRQNSGKGQRLIGQIQISGLKRMDKFLLLVADGLKVKNQQARLIQEWIRRRKSKYQDRATWQYEYGDEDYKFLEAVRARQGKGYKGSDPRDYAPNTPPNYYPPELKERALTLMRSGVKPPQALKVLRGEGWTPLPNRTALNWWLKRYAE